MNDNPFRNDSLYNLIALQQLEQQQSQDPLFQLLRNLQVSGQLSSTEGQGVSGYNYGGRVGSALPLGDGLFRAGLTGQGYNVNTPMGTNRDFNITGGDVGYNWGTNDMSLSYNNQGGTGGVPLIQLLFKKYFD
jgi:hypothetical protein